MDEQELLEKWKRRLCLHDWKIKLYVNCKPEEMAMNEVAGCTEWSESVKTARIEIIDQQYYGDRIVPFNFEKILIHELLHLKMSIWCQNEDNVEERVMHQIIDDLAHTFVENEGSENG